MAQPPPLRRGPRAGGAPATSRGLAAVQLSGRRSIGEGASRLFGSGAAAARAACCALPLGVSLYWLPSLRRGGRRVRVPSARWRGCKRCLVRRRAGDNAELRRLLLEGPTKSGRRSEADSSEAGLGRFFVVGSWSDWAFEEMVGDGAGSEQRRLYVDVRLASDADEFQIVVDHDWAQVLHPAADSSEVCADPSLAEGPDGECHGLNWKLDGRPGDLFRIELLRLPGGHPEGSSQDAWWVSGRELAVDERPSNMMALCQDSDNWECAIEYLEDMRRWGESPGPAELSVAIRACERGSAWESALALLEDVWGRDKQCQVPSAGDYEAVSRACSQAGEAELSAEVSEELGEWGPAPDVERFQLTPRVYWNRDVRRMGCSVHNTLDWQGGEPLPLAEQPCWLLPASDHVAVEIARRQEQLRKAGWKVLSCDPHVVSRLDNKAAFQEYACELGLSEHLPACFQSAERAAYPCVLKPAAGEFGRDARIVRSPQDVSRVAGDGGLGAAWVLQELIPGCFEYSTALLVQQGDILEVACTRYEYDAEEYVWPQVRELRKEARPVPPEHLAVMRALLAGYSGFINFNYKLRPQGRICIFEANARVGADLACDVPRPSARAMFERLDALRG